MEMKIDDFFKEYGVQHRDEETGNVETIVLRAHDAETVIWKKLSKINR